MNRTSTILFGAVILALLCGPRQASAQQLLPFPARPTVAPARPPAAPSPRAASCHNGASFDRFLADLKQQAAADGVSQRALAEAAPYLVYDQSIVNRDRGQRVFGQIFTEFAGRMAAPYRMQQGQARIKAYSAAFARAEKEYGVPPAVIAAFWGLESDFGANMGKLPTLRSLVSLAYDCRRSEMFANETIAALKIIDRGDLAPEEMIGSWAGELGQTQFLPTHYFNYAVDYDDDGRRNLLSSPPVGPAFLAYANFAAYTEWNNSLIYSTTAGYLASRIAGSPPMHRPSAPVAQLPFTEIRELQQLLVRAGFNVGKVDGVLGQQSRTAVKAMQIKYGLPADSWPTAELLAQMRGPRAQPRPEAALPVAR
jgi:membrane-bound lytic murein transglycosylase B